MKPSLKKKARKEVSTAEKEQAEKTYTAREKQAWDRVQANVALYSHQSSDVRDKSLRLAQYVMEHDPSQYKCIGLEIRGADNDDAKALARKAMERSPREYANIPSCIRDVVSDFSIEMAKVAIDGNPLIYMVNIAHAIKNSPVYAREIAEVAVRADSSMYKHIPSTITSQEDQWSKDIALLAVTDSNFNYKFVPMNLMHCKSDPAFSRTLAEAARTRVFAHMPMELKKTAQDWLKELGKVSMGLRFEEYQYLPWRGGRDADCRQMAEAVVTASRGDHYKHIPLTLRGEDSDWAFNLAQRTINYSVAFGIHIPSTVIGRFGVEKCAEMWAENSSMALPDGMRDTHEFKVAALNIDGTLYRILEPYMIVSDTEPNRKLAEIAIRSPKCGYSALPYCIRSSQDRVWAFRMALFASSKRFMYRSIPLHIRTSENPTVGGVPFARHIMRHALAAWPQTYQFVPDAIRETLTLEEHAKIVKEYVSLYKFLPKDCPLRSDIELCSQVLRFDVKPYKDFSDTVKRAVPVIIQVLQSESVVVTSIPKDALSQPGMGQNERALMARVLNKCRSEHSDPAQMNTILEWFLFEQPKAMMAIDPKYFTIWSRERELAIFMSLHSRLGANSPLAILGEANIRDLIIDRSNNQYFFSSDCLVTVPRIERFQLIEEAPAKDDSFDFGDDSFMQDVLRDLLS